MKKPFYRMRRRHREDRPCPTQKMRLFARLLRYVYLISITVAVILYGPSVLDLIPIAVAGLGG